MIWIARYFLMVGYVVAAVFLLSFIAGWLVECPYNCLSFINNDKVVEYYIHNMMPR